MPTSAELLVDTSAAIALVSPGNTAHARAVEVMRDHRLGLAGHAAFEFVSVTTRMPVPHRLDVPAALRLIAVNFPATQFLSPRQQQALLERLPRLGITGGAVYDALVAEAARVCEVPLVTDDQRALPTYLAIGCTPLLLT